MASYFSLRSTQVKSELPKLERAVSNRLGCLMVVVHLSQFVEGRTRLNLLAFLSSKRLESLAIDDFYQDWTAGKFGPVSKMLAADVERNLGTLLGKWNVKNMAGFSVIRYGLLASGEEIARGMMARRPDVMSSLNEVVSEHIRMPLKSFLAEVHSQYPEPLREKRARKAGKRTSSIRGNLLG